MKLAACYPAVIGLAAFVSGCGSGPTLVPVSGTVTADGVPLENASLAFLPNIPNPDGETSHGASGQDGRYEVKTAGHLGVVPGKYRVVVSWKPPLDPSLIPDEFKDDPFMAEMLIPPERKGKRKSKDSAPAEDKIEAAFTQEVPPAGGTLDFAVSRKAQQKAKPVRRTDK